jgi:hypothetical protein
MRKPGKHLAEQDLTGPQRCHQQLVEGALLAFPGDGQRRHQHGHHQCQHADNARHEEPAALQVRIEPGADFEPRRRAAQASGSAPVVVEAIDDTARVVEHDHGRVGVAAIDDDLQRSRPPASRSAVKRGPTWMTSNAWRASTSGAISPSEWISATR